MGYIIIIAILYFLIALLAIFAIVQSNQLDENKLSNRLLIVFGGLFWPITLVGLMLWGITYNLSLIIIDFFKWLIKGPNN